MADDFILESSQLGDDDDDARSTNRSAVNLTPHKNDFGNQFSQIKPNDRNSFFSNNDLASSSRINRHATFIEGSSFPGESVDIDKMIDAQGDLDANLDMLAQMNEF